MGRFSVLALTGALVQGALCSSPSLVSRQAKGEILTWEGAKYQCKCYEGSACWPIAAAWNSLNTTVGGRLTRALPPAAGCFDSVDGVRTRDMSKCDMAKAQWTNETWHVEQSVGNMWHFWTNDTCLPSQKSTACTRGFYPDYVIMAQKAEDIKAGVDFARENNIRLVIRNTGHDFMGRSTGYGSLAVNTHSFKEMTFVKQYAGPGSYRGGAVTVGAGVQGRELYKKAFDQKPPVIVVGGECPTVGFAGGYMQGGGHGPMTGMYGMAADNALSFKVITADGNIVTANEAENADLFWGLKGGGPSTFGAVVSVTVKTHPEVKSAAIILNINATHTNDSNVFWKGVKALHDSANLFADNAMYTYYELFPGSLHVQPILGPNMTAAQIDNIAKPMFQSLNSQKIPYSTVTKDFPTFFELYMDIFEDETAGQSTLVGGRLFTKKDMARDTTNLINAYRKAHENEAFLIGHFVAPGRALPKVDNAIHPAWRDASSFTISSLPVGGNSTWTEKAAKQHIVTNVVGKAMRDAAPDGAAYVNEGDLEEPNWQNEYWGTNYPRLLQLKKKWDPHGIFYARTTPGTEAWDVIDYGKKLCKKI